MILDSVLRIASHHIRTHGQLPDSVVIRRKGGVFTYPLPLVVRLASRVCGYQGSAGLKDLERAKRVIKKSSYLMYQKRLKSALAGWTTKGIPKVPIAEDCKVLDLRPGHVNVAGLAYERLLYIISTATEEQVMTRNHHVALIEALKDVELIIVPSTRASTKIQNYLARRVFDIIVLTEKQIEGYYKDTPPSYDWGNPTVGHS